MCLTKTDISITDQILLGFLLPSTPMVWELMILKSCENAFFSYLQFVVPNQVKILHMQQQLNCLGICKIMTWSDHYFPPMSNTYLCKIWIMSSWTVCGFGRSTIIGLTLCGSQSTLAQVMACCLMASSHYLNQYWQMTSGKLWHSPKCNFTGWYFLWYEFENLFEVHCHISQGPMD